MGQKIGIAKSNGIEVTINVEDIKFEFVDDIDMAAIFANLWDNAIDACLKINNGKRYIDVIIGRVNDFIVINFENSFDYKSAGKNDAALSAGLNHHDIGISIIRSSIVKYDGLVNVGRKTKFFNSTVLLPIQ